jgi:hypothetical protein
LADVAVIQNTLTGIAATGLAISAPVTIAAAIVVTGVIIADHISGGKIIQGIVDTIDSLISASAPVRDKERNPIPTGNQPQSPTGKSASSGPENIGDPGDLGGPNFKLPNKVTVATIIAVGSAAVTNVYDNTTDASSSPPPQSSTKKGK